MGLEDTVPEGVTHHLQVSHTHVASSHTGVQCSTGSTSYKVT